MVELDGALLAGLALVAAFALGVASGISFALGYALGSRRLRRDMIDRD